MSKKTWRCAHAAVVTEGRMEGINEGESEEVVVRDESKLLGFKNATHTCLHPRHSLLGKRTGLREGVPVHLQIDHACSLNSDHKYLKKDI